MRIAKEDIPVKIDVPGATARQITDFGDASGYGKIGGEYFSLGAGTDITPLLQGLDGDLCQCPHWGYLFKGQITIQYHNGEKEVLKAGDVYYLPPGHSGSMDEEAVAIEFSPEKEYMEVLEHIKAKMQALTGFLTNKKNIICLN